MKNSEEGKLTLWMATNLVPRSHSVTGNVRSGKVRFRACSVAARPKIRAFLSLRMFVLSVVVLWKKNMDFDSVLEEVLLVRGQGNLKLKQKQKEALQAIVVNGQDCLIVLPTGYGKSLIDQMLPLLFDKTNLSLNVTSEGKSIVIVVSPLNALIDDQINKLSSVGVACTSLRVCGADMEERILAIDDLQTGKFELIFTHPEVAVSNRQCRDLFLSSYYQRNVRAVVIDEAHCIIEW